MKFCSKYLWLLAVSLLVTSCATSNDGAYSPQVSEQQKRIAALQKRFPSRNYIIVYVEKPNNFISNRMSLSILKLGGSSANSDAIVKELSKQNSQFIAITGDDDSLSSATLERALYDGKGKISGKSVGYIGGNENLDALNKIAEEAGVSIDYIKYP
jgi:hypothetical protein